MKINRLLTNLCSVDLAASKAFYTSLLGFEVAYDSDWFVHLISKDKQFELGIIERTNQIVPKSSQNAPTGFYVTFVVDNADEVFAIAEKENFEVVEQPTDTPYGQRRLLLKDPNGTIVDVSSLIPNFKF